MRRNRGALVAMSAAVALTVAACGGDGGGTTDGAQPGGTTALEGTGPITYVSGKDTSGYIKNILDKWNAAHPRSGSR
jgi:multiple sugar transport system substrate-binding protein